MSKVVVIGGGPAGVFSAYFASKNGAEVILIEKNNMIGRKLRITGKGRCNITNASDIEDIIGNIFHNGSFMYSPLYSFTNLDLIKLLNDFGLKTKVERGNRVFPESDKALDVAKTLEKMLKDQKINILYSETVVDILLKDDKVSGVRLKSGKNITCDSVVLATGGKSYPLTGSNGDGYKLAKKLGHKVDNIVPSLIGIETDIKPNKEMIGLLLKNVSIKLYKGKKLIYEDFGELEFRDYGIDGAIIKSASCFIDDDEYDKYKIVLDLKPALSFEKLDSRIQRDFDKLGNKAFKDVLKCLLPSAMIDFTLELSEINPKKEVNQINKFERIGLVNLLKGIEFKIKTLRTIDEAIITKGGVVVKEINPSTMESKIIDNLFFAGEIIDVAGYTGGFNLQIAFSTGYLAGINSSI